MVQATRLLTAEEFFEMPEPLDHRLELVRGEVSEVAFASGDHNLIVDVICDALKAYARPQRLGVVFSDGAGFLLQRDPDTVRGPDAAYIVRERIPSGTRFPGVIPIIPDLTVEVVSATDRPSEVREKAEDYLAAGVRLVWVFWPETRTVTVYTPEAEPYTLTADETLDGGDVLPGFAVAAAELFAVDL